METSALIAECASLINKYGPDSLRVKNFIENNKEDTKFVKLAKVSCELKRALIKLKRIKK